MSSKIKLHCCVLLLPIFIFRSYNFLNFTAEHLELVTLKICANNHRHLHYNHINHDGSQHPVFKKLFSPLKLGPFQGIIKSVSDVFN